MFKQLFAPVFRKALQFILYCMKVRIHGLENLDNIQNKGVLVCNHVSTLDVMNLFAFLPENVVYAINKKNLTNPLAKWAMRYANVINFDHLNPEAINNVVDTVKNGNLCLIFAENQVTSTGTLMKIYDAPGIVADRADAPIIPVWIQGAKYGYCSQLRGKIPVRPMPKTDIYVLPPKYYKINSKENRELVSHDIYQVLLEASFKASFTPGLSLFKNVMKTAKIYGKDGWIKRRKVITDIERKSKSFKDLLLASYVLGGKFNQFTQQDERVGVLLPNTIPCIATIFGLSAYKRIVTMLNYTFSKDNMISCCQTAKVKQVITSKKFIAMMKGQHFIEAFQNEGINVIYLEDIKKTISLKNKLHALWLYKRKTVPFENGGENTCFILFTTGSEGRPKAVNLSHDNIMANIHQIATLIPINKDDLTFNVLPVFHAFGLTGGTLFPLLSGSKVFLYPSPLHYRIIPELCYEYKATIMFGTDTFIRNYAKVAHPFDFYTLKYIVAGAEALKKDTVDLWYNRFGIRVLQGYGATETSPVLSVNTPIMWRKDAVGQMLPGIEFRLDKVEGVENAGELVVKGPNIMKGYYMHDNPDVLQAPEGGWYKTGDVVEVDQHGYIFIRDRIKRFAKLGGEMVSLSAVEKFAKKAYKNLDFDLAAVAIAHGNKGEQIILVVNNNDIDISTIASYIQANKHSNLYVPKAILFVEDIPVTGSGKKDYIKIKKIAISKVA